MLLRDFNSALFFFVNARGSKQRKARPYLKPAKVSGGISARPHLISMKDVDQRNVTSKASNIDLRCNETFTVQI